MGKQVYFNDDEIEQLNWIVGNFIILHKDEWNDKEADLCQSIQYKITTKGD